MSKTKNTFLPLFRQEATNRGWDELDIVLITGDAYVDHPSFGTAVIGRVLESRGYRVGIIAMPDWKNPQSIDMFGKPRLFFGVTSGNVDSMLARYTSFKRYRSDDPYVPGNKAGRKPERAVIVYCNMIKALYKDVPIVLGGIEASMRRLAHYDYWSNKVRRSIIEDTRADILVYGMGESQITEIADRLSENKPLDQIPGTVVLSKSIPDKAMLLPAEEEVMASKDTFLEFYKKFYRNQHRIMAQPTAQRYIVHYPQPTDISTASLDAIHELPFSRKPHSIYRKPIPAYEMIRDSINSHRGCVSGCSFCSLSLHQGRQIISRSQKSILKEVEKIAAESNFKGHISDIGGPSANMYGFECKVQWKCRRESCTHPALCQNLVIRTDRWVDLMKQARKIPGVSKVTIGSGIRYDILMRDPNFKVIFRQIAENHISGQLKIAPEHTSEKTLRAMRKSPLVKLEHFISFFRNHPVNKKKKQHLLPYLMSNHPGTDLQEMKVMKQTILKLFRFIPNQVQSFIPLPMTLSSVIYYTGVDPLTGERFFAEQDMNQKRRQHQVFFSK